MKEVELINQVGEWSKRNFGELQAPELGVVEEIGEAAHAELKYFQRIRGLDLAAFQDAFTDALGDAMIFLCNWCYLHNAYFQFEKAKKTPRDWAVSGFPSIMQHLLQATSAMFSTAIIAEDITTANLVAQRITQGLTFWACKYDFDLPLIVHATWLSVSKRDWKADDKTGRHS